VWLQTFSKSIGAVILLWKRIDSQSVGSTICAEQNDLIDPKPIDNASEFIWEIKAEKRNHLLAAEADESASIQNQNQINSLAHQVKTTIIFNMHRFVRWTHV